MTASRTAGATDGRARTISSLAPQAARVTIAGVPACESARVGTPFTRDQTSYERRRRTAPRTRNCNPADAPVQSRVPSRQTPVRLSSSAPRNARQPPPRLRVRYATLPAPIQCTASMLKCDGCAEASDRCVRGTSRTCIDTSRACATEGAASAAAAAVARRALRMGTTPNRDAESVLTQEHLSSAYRILTSLLAPSGGSRSRPHLLNDAMADVRHDPMTGRWVAIAPARALRPGASAPTSDSAEDCPFCAGHEDQTPPEALRLGGGPTGWDVRVVPNLYPALERQEVVIHGPVHVQSVGDLPDATLDRVAEAWQRRARDVGGHCFPLLNEGRDAGASLPHSHSQLAWLPAPAPAVVGERGLPEVIPVLERDGLVAGCPVASRVPYEVLIAPARSEPEGLRSDLLGSALCLLAELVRRLHRVRGEPLVPLNAWLHEGPHWHLELFPRTTRLAGLELGAGVYIDAVAPERAADELRTGS